jgi:hypothetical protein
MRFTLKRCLLFAAPIAITTVFLFQNCGPAQVNVGDSSMDMASLAPPLGSTVDLAALLKSAQEPSTNVLVPLMASPLTREYANSAPIIETVVLKKNTFDRIAWVQASTATIVANGDTFNNKQYSSDMQGTYYVVGYRGQTSFLVAQFQLAEKSKPAVAADTANAVTASQLQVDLSTTTETIMITVDATDVDSSKITFLQKNNGLTISDKRAILITKKLSDSFDVDVTVADISQNTVTKTLTLTAKACDFNGYTILNGSSATAYQTSSVPYGQICTSQTRTCTAGVLGGTYTNANCSVSPPANCSFNGFTVAHGASVNAYATATVPYGQTCVAQSRTCNNGVLSGTYTLSSCTVQPPAPCTFDGKTIASGAVVNAYATTTVPYGQTCTSQTRTCTNGILSGTNPYSACSIAPAVNLMHQMAPVTVTVARGAILSISLLVTNLQATPTALLGFVHIVPSGSSTASLSIDFEPGTASNLWPSGSSLSKSVTMTIPTTLAVGTYTVRAGFYQRVSPYTRLKMDMGTGVTDDGTQRYIVGTMTVK